jgi:hypothetical protein
MPSFDTLAVSGRTSVIPVSIAVYNQSKTSTQTNRYSETLSRRNRLRTSRSRALLVSLCWATLVAISAGAELGCGRPDAGARSPTNDYPLPPAQTGDGEVIGADRKPPEDKLREGPRVGDDGVKPGSRPGELEPGAPPSDRCRHMMPSDPRWKVDCVEKKTSP